MHIHSSFSVLKTVRIEIGTTIRYFTTSQNNWITLNSEILHAYIQVVTFYMYMFNSNKHNFLNIRTED